MVATKKEREYAGDTDLDRLDDDEVTSPGERIAGFDEFADEGDSEPDDRRRDPLRR